MLGSLLGAAIITGSMVVGDTMNASIRQVARTHLGPIDELVSTRGPIDQQQLLTVYRPLVREDGDIDGILALSWMDGAVTTTGPRLLSAPRAQVLGVDFEAARRFGGDAAATGIAGPTPALGHAAISSDLARALALTPGARIAVRAFGLRSELVVDRILPRRGIAGFWLGAEQESRNVLVSPTTFDRITSGAGSGVPPTWAIAVSNRGGVESGASRTDRVLRALRAASPAPPLDPQIYAAKQTTLDTADTVGKGFSSMFTAMGSFGVLAGLLLLVNLFVMLAAERKAELGMARAVGMRRSELVAVFATEGWLYALTATALGVLTGIGLGRILVAVSARVFSTEHNRFDLFFTVQPRSLAVVVRDRLHGRPPHDRAHEHPGEPAQHHPRDPRPRGAAPPPGQAALGRRSAACSPSSAPLATAAGSGRERRLRAPARADARDRRARAARSPSPPRAHGQHARRAPRRRLGRDALRPRPLLDGRRERDAVRRPGDRAHRRRGRPSLAAAGPGQPGAPTRHRRALAVASARARLPARPALAHRPHDRDVRARRLHPHLHHLAGAHDRPAGRNRDPGRAGRLLGHPRLEPGESRAAGPGGEPGRGHDRGAAFALARVLPGGLDDERRTVEHDRVRPALRRTAARRSSRSAAATAPTGTPGKPSSATTASSSSSRPSCRQPAAPAASSSSRAARSSRATRTPAAPACSPSRRSHRRTTSSRTAPSTGPTAPGRCSATSRSSTGS